MLNSFAQPDQRWVQKAKEAESYADYLAAAEYYKAAYELNGSNLEHLHNRAMAFLWANDYVRAKTVFKKVVELDLKKSFAESYFWLARMHKYAYDFEQASNMFSAFSKTYRRASAKLKRAAKNEIFACKEAKKIIDQEHDVDLKRFPDHLNSQLADFAPRYSGNNQVNFSALDFQQIAKDGKISKKEAKDQKIQIFTTQFDLKTEQFSKKKKLDAVINNLSFNNANAFFAPWQNTVYFSRCNDLECKIYFAEKKNNEYVIPKEIEGAVNVEGASSTQPFLFKYKKHTYMLFASNKKGSKGGFDLYLSKQLSPGKFSAVKNLGRNINTDQDEVAPFYDTLNDVLYFSSNGHLGLGGFDIFKSEGSVKKFEMAQNIGIPFNSAYQDLYYSVYDDSLGFLSSNRPTQTSKGDSSVCCSDLFYFKKDLNKSSANDSISDSLIVARQLRQIQSYLPTLYFDNDHPNPKTIDTTTDLTYIQTYDAYVKRVEVYKQEYSKGLPDSVLQDAKNEMQDFFKHYVDQGLKDLDLFMKHLSKALESGSAFQLKIKGYASPLAKSDYNEKLTLRRIASLINYIKAYDGQKLKKYVDQNILSFEKVPFGEYKADQSVSDDYDDKQNSVYSIQAAKERKIEVLSVELNKTEQPVLLVDSVIDLGKVKQSQIHKGSILLKNNSSQELVIYSIESDCSCTVADQSQISLQPGASSELNFTIHPKQKGLFLRALSLQYSGIVQQSKIIRVKAEVY